MRWLLNLFGHQTEPPPLPPPDPRIVKLDEWAEKVATEEFGGGCTIYKVGGIHEISREVRTSGGLWLAEVGFSRITHEFYRVTRERALP